MLQKKVTYNIVISSGEKMEKTSEILKWYLFSGVDEICGNEPLNILQADHPQNKSPENATEVYYQSTDYAKPQQPLRPATTLLAQTNGEAYINAQEICQQAQSLPQLKSMVEKFEGCSLRFSANSTVFGDGNPQAKVMIIGEAPGADEDRIGKPFVGRSGQLLTRMLQSIGLQREECFISNILPWRPPGNRTPTDSEIAVCLPFLRRQIELVAPQVILLLGGSAANAVLNNADSISALRGHFIDYSLSTGRKIPTLSTFHPAYLLRSAAQKSKVWADLLRLQRKLQKM